MRSAEFAEKRQYADALFNTRIALVYEDNEHIALQIGFLEYKLGEFADAHMSLINAAERNPEVPLPFYWLGRVYEASNDHKRALNAYTVAHKIGLRGASLDLAIARSAIKTGDTETAEKHESTLAEGAAASPTAFGFFYAQLAWEQQRSDIAARRLDSVLSVAPTLVDALVFRLLLELQNPDGEVEIARDLLSKLSEAEGHGARWAVASILASHRFSLTLETTPQASVEAYRDAEWRLLLDDPRVLGGASMDREIVPNLIDRSLEVTMANVLFEAEPLPKRD
jgi:tetratricopeptide (TPR) repeat protein